MSALRVGVVGYRGRMGSLACTTIDAEPDLTVVSRVGRGDDWPTEPLDVLVDLGTGETAQRSLEWGDAHRTPVVVGSTGLDDVWLDQFGRSIDGTVGFAVVPNFSLSAALITRFAAEAIRRFESCEIIEYSHPRKLEAPSGTAMATARALGAALGGRVVPDGTTHLLVEGARGAMVNGVSVHSARLAGIMSRQDVLLGNGSEVMTLKFEALDRGAYMPGLLLVLRAMPTARGLTIGLEPFLTSTH